MGLIAHMRRLRYVYGWRARYWYLDTRSGRFARALLIVCAWSALAGIVTHGAVLLARVATSC